MPTNHHALLHQLPRQIRFERSEHRRTGALRRLVHAVLERHELVVAFRLADEGQGGWGATLVQLRPPRRG